MTAPADSVVREEVSIEDMAALAEKPDETPAKPKAADIKLDADDLPDEFKGKSAAELANLVSSTRDAVRISEEARKRAEAAAQTASATAAQSTREQQLPPDPLDLVTDDHLKKLIDEEGTDGYIKALRIVEARARRDAEVSFGRRLSGLAKSGADASFEDAKKRYVDEFELFGEEISAVASQIPAAQLASPASWDTLIGAIRGRGENIEKLFAHRSQKTSRKEAVDTSGFVPSGSSIPARAPAPAAPGGNNYGLDETQREIARKQFPEARTPEEAYREYARWFNMG